MGRVMDEVLSPSWARRGFRHHRAALGKVWTPGAAPLSRGVVRLGSVAQLSRAVAAGALEQTLRVLKGFERS